ncbi:MAG TPA: globin [Sulfurimonas sp.]|jgi:hemoglobin|uniref:Hemoglobin-like protein HbO n=1 Tax=hydrothermal vent metagenome TaxID=652676 RepID=A0A1W1B998_9ZZZZ|nr:MAG: Group 2 truncated hemoglobin GlbO [uncultured Sulfurimonas sp.]CAI6155616.1 MAG: Group 2 truncated hemoglobin GlbO [uncultured Sulfurimonas sp.]HIC12674.1 globin [Sulfurimonas sp.]HIM75710.1 globin [Campylobacterales bacterium]
MNLEIMQAQFGVRTPVSKAIPEFLLEMGEDGIRKMVSDHYDKIKQSEIYDIFPQDAQEFEDAKKHSADFMIQICGGPAHFTQNRGAPQMVGRHNPFRITAQSRQVWLELYREVLMDLEKEGITEKSLSSWWNYVNVFSNWMVNTPN